MTIKETIIENGYFIDIPTPELARQLNCSETTIRNYRNGMRHAIKGWFPEVGARWEKWASEELLAKDIPNKLMPYRHPFDILANNGLRIEVKVARKPLSAPSSQCVNPAWSFKILKLRKPDAADIFMLIIAPEKLVFIIPNNELPELDHIRFCYPTNSPSGLKYGEFLNAYHLIRDYGITKQRVSQILKEEK